MSEQKEEEKDQEELWEDRIEGTIDKIDAEIRDIMNLLNQQHNQLMNRMIQMEKKLTKAIEESF